MRDQLAVLEDLLHFRPAAPPQHRYLYMRDQLAVLEDIFNVSPLARHPVELCQRNLTPPSRTLDVHGDVKRGESDAEIGGVKGDAVLSCAKDRMHPSDARDGRATGAR